jgi:hypothetical protein
MKICSFGSELLQAFGRTDMTKLVVAFRNFEKAPRKDWIKRISIRKQIRVLLSRRKTLSVLPLSQNTMIRIWFRCQA